MRQRYTFKHTHSLQPTFFLLIFLMPVMLHAQINKATLSNFQACGGATLVPSVQYTGGATPVTIYYEMLVGADTWQLEGTQQFNACTSFIQYNGSDLSEATMFRIRALDEITGNIYTSNSVSVDPAKWNVDRGTAFSTAFAYWGSNCSNGFIGISIYSDTKGRPPYTIEYKKYVDANYVVAGETIGYWQIGNIDAGVAYSVRITDKCGNVTTLNASLIMSASATVTQPASTCNSHDGIITVNTESDSRYSGVPPFKYRVHKYGSTGADTAYVSGNVFNNLSAGTYEYGVRDACGHSYIKSVVLGAGTPEADATFNINALDSCYNDVVIHAAKGTAPFTYALRANNGAYTTSTDSVFKVKDFGYYYFYVMDNYGSKSTEKSVYVTGNFSIIDSVKWIGNNCIRDLVVYTSGKLGLYTFYLNSNSPGNYRFRQTTDTFHNIISGNFSLSVVDRCGRLVDTREDIQGALPCYLRTDTGSFESKGSAISCLNIGGTDWIDIHDDQDNLIYSINPNGNTMNSTCWGIHVEDNQGDSLRSSSINGAVSYFLDRNFYIQPPANATFTDSVSVRLYVTDDELNDMLYYLSNQGLSYTLDDLKILKKKGAPGSLVNLLVTDDANSNMSQFVVIKPIIGQYGPGAKYMEFKVKDFSEFNPYIGSFKVLAVNLLSLTATEQGKNILLNWKASLDMHTRNFEIQWSNTGNSFKTVGIMNAQASATVSEYNFTHTTLVNGTNFYRLKTVEKDGTYSYSKIVSATFTGKNNVIVTPNPVHDKLSVQFDKTSNYKMISVYDLAGKLLLQKSLTTGSLVASMNIQHLPAGIYVLEAAGDVPQRMKFVKN